MLPKQTVPRLLWSNQPPFGYTRGSPICEREIRDSAFEIQDSSSLRFQPALGEVRRAIPPPQEKVSPDQVSPLPALRRPGSPPLGALQEMRRAAEAQVTPRTGSS
jgi:hypothetical protein